METATRRQLRRLVSDQSNKRAMNHILGIQKSDVP
jgi:hypothetical protein